MRVVIDANVFISGLLTKKGPPGQILDAWLEGLFSLFVSPQIAAEIQRVFKYPRIRERLGTEQAGQFLTLLDAAAEWVEGSLGIKILARDPSDNIYLSCAVEAKADFLVTGNIKHFSEAGNPYQGVNIVTPRQFTEILTNQYKAERD